MRLVIAGMVPLAFGISVAFAGGGKVTSTDKGPAPLSPTTTDAMLETMGMPAMDKRKVTYVAPERPAAPEPEASPGTADTAAAPAVDPAPVVVYSPPPRTVIPKAADGSLEMAKATVLDPRPVRQCIACHGLDGAAKVPGAGNLAGAPADYLIAQMDAYRTGEREHPVMSVIAERLSAEQIEAQAAWYASRTPQ